MINPMIENPFTWVYFPTALGLGALHALEPGHAKTLTAAYLMGINGTKKDALFLGLSVAFTHSIVVIGLLVIALWIGRKTFTDDVGHWLQISSGIIVVILGTWMLVKRLRHKFHTYCDHHAPEPVEIIPFEMREPHNHNHNHNHNHLSDDEHAQAHAATLPEYVKEGNRPSSLQILAFGAAGGMIPCPASITVMLLALSIGQLTSGLIAVAGFGLGLAATLVGVGMIVVAGMSRLTRSSGKLHWLTTQATIISAFVVILSGCAALLFAL